MRTYIVTVFPEDLPKLEAVAHRLWESGFLGASLVDDGASLVFDDDVYDELDKLGTGVDGYVSRYGMGIGEQLYCIRQVA